MILDKAIKDFRAQESETPKFMHNLTNTWVKPTDDFKEPPLCFPLRNLLLYFPGGISVDESGNRLFLSDSNHHRVIVLDGNGMILDSIGSSPGHEDGEFESAKLRCPAASFYHAAEDCLYLVDSENHAIRRADMGKRIVETLYPRSETNKNSSIWSWILGKLRPTNDLDAESEKLNLDVSVFPWHILKSPNGDLLIFNRSCETTWIMDFASGLIREVVKGFSNILEICEPLILEKLTLLNQIPNDWLQQQVDAHFSSKRIPYVELISSVGTFQYQILFCDTVGQTVSKLYRNLGSISGFQFSNLGILGFPYWSLSPLERVCAADAALAGNSIDHIESFNLLPENLMDIIIITRFHHGGKFVQVGRNGNQQMFPIAWAVVDQETKHNWSFFINYLIQDLNLGTGHGLTVMSDMQKGLLPTIAELLPHCEQRMCRSHKVQLA